MGSSRLAAILVTHAEKHLFDDANNALIKIKETILVSDLLHHLDEHRLAHVFRGELAFQNSKDGPAKPLLTKVRQARAAAPKAKRRPIKKANTE